MSGFKRLQINLLSPSGELLNCVSCFGGQVSVFRAVTQGALEPYQRALLGMPGPEKISILLDGAPFHPNDHIHIGFGEQFVPQANSVQGFLVDSGVPEETLDTLLVSYGLERVCHSRWSNLTPCEERRLRLLSATYQPDKILILNDPFDPISGQWKERFAELLTTFARTKRHIVIVTRLSTRPESWIDNESIARIQVGENIQKTIGFGSGPSAVNQLVSEMREIMKDEAKVKEFLESGSFSRAQSQKIESPPPKKSINEDNSYIETEDYPSSPKFNFRPYLDALRGYSKEITIGTGALIVLGLAFSFFFKPSPTNETVQVASIREEPASEKSSLTDNRTERVATSDQALPVQEPIVVKEEPIQAIEEPAPVKVQHVALVLDGYPNDIRASIVDAVQANYIPPTGGPLPTFNRTRNENKGPPAKEEVVKKNQEAGELLKLLQAASNTAKDSGSTVQSPSLASTSYVPSYNTEASPSSPGADSLTPEDQKREVIRQKFLEAIERAAEKRRSGG